MWLKRLFCHKHRTQGWELHVVIITLPVDVSIKKYPASIQKMFNRNCPNYLRNFIFQLKLPYYLCSVSLQNTPAYITQSHTSGISITACVQILHIQTMCIHLLFCITSLYEIQNLIPNHK